ncbi:phospho-sugar mutase [Estrella lausannensis]|uniref:Phosphoglucomutase/phosphomannomutase n=1 Tax=Estrella lausannensis TaxID=483423 RepID=A0A0H5E5L7_9BACT|nr:phospho-sugar mutase [Estrella lausannensis]CRX38530.1 Phosphoglucomutase/phosphomannomutase [Estrella lausannensis]
MNTLLSSITDAKAKENIALWLEGTFSDQDKLAVRDLIRSSPKEAIDAFYKKLEFGTGGIRGIMGLGTNRMNRFTIAAASQALADYLKEQNPMKKRSVMIGYDNRINSREFAEEAARTFAGNGIRTLLIKHLRPTPYISFGMRMKGCDAACMITASHNPKEYNGFKVYWDDGGQVLPPHDLGIIRAFERIRDPSFIEQTESLNHPLIVEEEEEIDRMYLETLKSLQCQPKINEEYGDRLKIIYTSLHGTGITLMPELMSAFGFSNITLVKEQCVPDGSFAEAPSPNPEERAALKKGIELMMKQNGDILIATDPDADRVGAAVNHQGEPHILTGNQIAALLSHHVFHSLKKSNKLPPKSACIKSIVTTELMRKIANHYNVQCFDILPGFKYVAEKIREWEKGGFPHQFILAAEESYGYLFRTETRDKDALLSASLLCEAALTAKLEGKTLIDILKELYKEFGVFLEKQMTLNFPETKAGREALALAMEKILTTPPTSLLGKRVISTGDLKSGVMKNLLDGKESPIDLPKTDMVILKFEKGLTVMIRPSGTEPKIKIYLMIEKGPDQEVEKALQEAESEAAQASQEIATLLKS